MINKSKKSFANPITAEAVILHGCQDDSLAKIILNNDLEQALVNKEDLPSKEHSPTRECFEIYCSGSHVILEKEELLSHINSKKHEVSEIYIEGALGPVEGPPWKLEPLGIHNDQEYYYTVILDNRIFVSGIIRLKKTLIITPEVV